MKKYYKVLITAFLAVILMTAAGSGHQSIRTAEVRQKKDILRFHMVADSDSPEDQNLKLEVKDEVVRSIKQDFLKNDIDSKAKAVNYLRKNMSKYIAIGENVVNRQGYSYKIKGKMGKTYYPVKVYNGVIFPEGEYDAFNMEIGQARGRNWWCVIFPDLCVIDEKQQEAEKNENENEFSFVEWFKNMWYS